MDKKYMNNFKPMSGIQIPTFENIDDMNDLFKLTKEMGILVDDSMQYVDKIKIATSMYAKIIYYFMMDYIDTSTLQNILPIIMDYISSIPNDSIDIMNAKNDFLITCNTLDCISVLYGHIQV